MDLAHEMFRSSFVVWGLVFTSLERDRRPKKEPSLTLQACIKDANSHKFSSWVIPPSKWSFEEFAVYDIGMADFRISLPLQEFLR